MKIEFQAVGIRKNPDIGFEEVMFVSENLEIPAMRVDLIGPARGAYEIGKKYMFDVPSKDENTEAKEAKKKGGAKKKEVIETPVADAPVVETPVEAPAEEPKVETPAEETKAEG